MNPVETRVLLSDFAQQLRRKTKAFQTLTLLYLKLLVYLQPWFWIKMPLLNREEAESLSKYESQKLQILYRPGGAAYGSARILVRSSNLTVSKVRQNLHSKTSWTKFTLDACKFKRMKAVTRFKNKTWCLNLAFVDKLARVNNGVKYLLFRQDQFPWPVDAKRLKAKDS